MQIVKCIKVTNTIVKDLDCMTRYIRKHLDIAKAECKKTGHSLTKDFFVELFEQDGDNVLKGLVTIRLSFTAYKSPRFIRRHLAAKQILESALSS